MPESVPESKINAIINESEIDWWKMGDKTMVCHATLPNGFEIVTSAACNDPADYDAAVGEKITMRRLKDKVWELMGFQAHGEL